MKKTVNWINNNKLLCVILGIGTFLRFYKLDFQSLWLDELYTMNVANPANSYGTIIDEVYLRESFPYFYFFVENSFFKIFGFNSLVARIPSALFGTLTILALYKLVKLLYNKSAALVASILLAINEFHIFYSQDARAYSFYIFGVILSFYFLLKILENQNRKSLIGYIVCSAFMINTNFFSIINLFSQGIIFSIYIVFVDKENRKKLISYLLISYTSIFLFFIPNITKFIALLGFDSGWIPAPTKDGITKIFNEFFRDSEFVLFFITLLSISYLMKLLKSKNTTSLKETKKNKVVYSFIILTIWIFTLVFINVFKSYTSNSTYISRYFSSLLPPVLIILSLGFEFIKNKILKISLLSVFVVFSLLDLFVVNKYYDQPCKTQFREASEYLKTNYSDNQKIYSSLPWFFNYYFKNEKVKINEKEINDLLSEVKTDTLNLVPFWYISAHGNEIKINENLNQFIEENYIVDKSFNGYDAWVKRYMPKKMITTNINIKKFYPYSENIYGHNIKTWVERNEKINDELFISGWSILKELDSKNSSIYIILFNENSNYNFIANSISRPDITTVENDGYNYTNSGFELKVNLKDLKQEDYKVGVYISNNKEEGFYITEKVLSNK